MNQKLVLQALDRIENSKTFQNAEIYFRILKFLSECLFNQTQVKESLIEVALFKDKKGQSYDGKVRVYMYNLRKKLNEYYQKEGKNEDIILKIEKGQYNLSIDHKRSKKLELNKKWIFLLVTIFIAALLLITSLFGKKSTRCWEQFFESGKDNICYVGDHYTLWGELSNGFHGSVHFEGIVSEDEFDQNKDRLSKPFEKLDKTDYSFITKMGPISSSKLTKWFAEHDSELEISMESDLNSNDLTQNNIIYIGPYKTLSFLRDIFLRDSKLFELRRHGIYDIENKLVIKDRTGDNIWEEYVMVSLNKLSDGDNQILFFAANNDIGVMGAVSNFTNQEWLEEFYRNLPNNHTYFNALFKVSGLARTHLDCELVKLEML